MKITYPNGTTRWRNSQGKIHRINGPAIHYNDGDRAWYLNGNYHRTNGPAYEKPSGTKFWYINGINYSETNYNKILKLSQKLHEQ